jgi:hypothetical protein
MLPLLMVEVLVKAKLLLRQALRSIVRAEASNRLWVYGYRLCCTVPASIVGGYQQALLDMSLLINSYVKGSARRIFPHHRSSMNRLPFHRPHLHW